MNHNSLLGPKMRSMLWLLPAPPLPGTHSYLFYLSKVSNGKTQYCLLVSAPAVPSPSVTAETCSVVPSCHAGHAQLTSVRPLIPSSDSPACPTAHSFFPLLQFFPFLRMSCLSYNCASPLETVTWQAVTTFY